MKKLVALVAIVILASPLYGQQVTLTGSDEGGGVLGIRIKAGPGDPNVPVGISFIVNLTNSANIGDPNTAASELHPDYDVAIDAAYEIGTGYNPGQGTPMANPNGPGYPQSGVSTFAVSMGRLDPAPHDSLDSNPILLEIQLFGDGSTDVDFTTDTLRGGFVGTGSAIVLNDIVFVGTTVDLAAACSFPSCWNFLTQCHGDGNADGKKNLTDFFDLVDAFGTDKTIDPEGTAEGEYNPCADYDRSGKVNLTDFFILVGVDATHTIPFGSSGLPTDCTTGDFNNVFCP